MNWIFKKIMKRVIVILSILIVSTLFLVSCEKDVNGIPVKYYENVTGEGYVFEKYTDGTIKPHKWVGILAREKQDEINGEDLDNYYHVDNLETDNNGKYTCRFLEKKRPSVWAWGWKTMKFYEIFSGNYSVTITGETVQEAAKKATKKNPQVIPIDTIWVFH